jgi:hypothetical protein
VEILRLETTAMQNLRPFDMKIDSKGPSSNKNAPLRGVTKNQ